MIPLFIHQICPKNAKLTSIGWWKKLHPEWECTLWTLTEGKALVHRFYPEFAAVYDTFQSEEEQIQALRIFLLHRYGGLVVDHRLYPKRKIDSFLLHPDIEVYVLENHGEWLLACKDKCDFITDYLERLHSTVNQSWWKWVGHSFMVRKRTNFIKPLYDAHKIVAKQLNETIMERYVEYEPLEPVKRWKAIYTWLIIVMVFVILYRLRKKYYPRPIMLFL